MPVYVWSHEMICRTSLRHNKQPTNNSPNIQHATNTQPNIMKPNSINRRKFAKSAALGLGSILGFNLLSKKSDAQYWVTIPQNMIDCETKMWAFCSAQPQQWLRSACESKLASLLEQGILLPEITHDDCDLDINSFYNSFPLPGTNWLYSMNSNCCVQES